MHRKYHRYWLLVLLLLMALFVCAPTALAAEENIEDWHTLLVNPWNKLPAGYTVSLKTVTAHYKVDERCHADLTQMLRDCRAAGYEPQICSAYRTRAQQSYLYNNNVSKLCNAGYSYAQAKIVAAKSVAVPDTSEHQLGLAVDLVDADYPYLNNYQARQDTQKWLMQNSWKYGFTLRYPTGKTAVTGIVYEPWHYRYVGHYLAEILYKSGLTLEEYLDKVPECAPVLESQALSENKVRLCWQAVKGAERYEIYRRGTETGEFYKYSVCTDTTYKDVSLASGKIYEYKVRAVSKDGVPTGFSDTVFLTRRPVQPKLTGTNRSDGKVKLMWDTIENADHYEIYRAASKNGTYRLLRSTKGTAYRNVSITLGRTYHYKIRAVTKNGLKSEFSEIVSVPCRPARPKAAIALNKNGKPRLTWKTVPGAVSYEIYRSTSLNGRYEKMSPQTKPRYNNPSAKSGKTYYYKVRAVSKNGTVSHFSDPVSIKSK